MSSLAFTLRVAGLGQPEQAPLHRLQAWHSEPVLALQALGGNVISRQIEACIDSLGQRLFFQLLQFKIGDRNDPLVVGQLFEERAQTGETS